MKTETDEYLDFFYELEEFTADKIWGRKMKEIWNISSKPYNGFTLGDFIPEEVKEILEVKPNG